MQSSRSRDYDSIVNLGSALVDDLPAPVFGGGVRDADGAVSAPIAGNVETLARAAACGEHLADVSPGRNLYRTCGMNSPLRRILLIQTSQASGITQVPG